MKLSTNPNLHRTRFLPAFVVAWLALFQQLCAPADALAVGTKKPPSAGSSSSLKYPTFNTRTERWEEPPDAEEGYGLVGTLLRNGPVPFFTRLTNPDDYTQAVLKFQASERCSKNVAQGNMDAYFENPNDWAYQRVEEEKGGYKKDYGAAPDGKQVALTVTWGLGVTYFLSNLALELVGLDVTTQCY
jgi:hypothetical protein